MVIAAVCHVAASTPPGSLFTTAFSTTWVNESVTVTAPKSQSCFGFLPDETGLGIEVDETALGDPLFDIA